MIRLQPSFDVSTCSRWLCVGLPIALGVAVTLAAFRSSREMEYREISSDFDRRAEAQAADLTRTLDSCQDILHDIRRFYNGSEEVNPEEFRSFTEDYLEDRAGIESLEWAPRERRTDPDDPAIDEFDYPVRLVEPSKGSNQSRAGIDLGSDPALYKALQQSFHTGKLMAMPREPSDSSRGGFLLFIPIYVEEARRNGDAARPKKVPGFVLGRFNMAEIVEASLADRKQQDIQLRITDSFADGNNLLFEDEQQNDPHAKYPRHSVMYEVKDEGDAVSWQLDFTASPDYVAARRGWAPWLVLGAGLLLTVMLGGLLHTITGRAAKIQQLVEQRTAALERSRADLQLAADLEKAHQAELDFAYLAAGQHADTGSERATILRQMGEESVGLESFDAILDAWAWQARNLIGAHQSGVSYFPHGNIAEGIHAISLSDKYEKYRTYDVLPTGEGIWKLVVGEKLSFCMTDEQLQSHPAWKNFSDLLDERGLEHPPMRGWLAVPVLSHDHEFIGLLQLSDKYEGEFTQDDLQRLSRLAQLMAPTFSLQYVNEELYRRNVELGNAKDALELSNVELQQFAYIASHDLQTPLRSIAAFAQFLQKDYEGRLDEQADDYINRLVGGVKRMQKLITDLLAYSRVESRAAPFAAVDLNQLCDDVVVLLLRPSMEDAGGRVTRDPLPTVVGDRSQLSQLLQNLIDNALKYRHEDPPRVHLSAEQNGNAWKISVRDNGIGIDVKHHEQIFEVFRRLHTEREYPGTGVGLAICRRIVQRHGGHLWLESEPGKGSTFYFTIPECSHAEHASQPVRSPCPVPEA